MVITSYSEFSQIAKISLVVLLISLSTWRCTTEETTNTGISIEFISAKSFINNDTSWFKIIPEDYYSVALRPKKTGCFLIPNGKEKSSYLAYVNELDSIYLDVTRQIFNENSDELTVTFQFKTISKK